MTRGATTGVGAAGADLTTGSKRPVLWASGSLVGAILASACCVGPLLLLSLGVSGTWIANLTALESYKTYFAVATLILIGLGFRRVYFERKLACNDARLCARPAARRIVEAALWLATVLVALAITIDYWAPVFY